MMKMRSFPRHLHESVRLRHYALALLLAVFATLVVFGLEHLTVEKFSNINDIFTISVLASAIYLGKGPAMLNAMICVYLYDVVLMPPLLEITHNFDNMIKFGVFAVVAILTSLIAGRARSYAIQLQRRETELMNLLDEKETLEKQKQEERLQRQAERFRATLLTSVSHDLKTPLASIIGALSSLKSYRESLSPGDRQRLIDSSLQESNRLLGFVNNILDVARLEGGNTNFRPVTTAVDDIVDLTIKRLRSRLASHRLAIDLQSDLQFFGDERLMDVALGNIVDNAVKYAPDGSTIHLRAHRAASAGEIVIEIEDEGPGIEREFHEKIFEKQFRQEQADNKKAGTGLGLWIAREIIQSHGGTIRIADNAGSQGTVVRITIPLEQPVPHSDYTEAQAA